MTYFGIEDRKVYSVIIVLAALLHHGGIVGVAPAPGKIAVMIVVETEDANKLTQGQRDVMSSHAKGGVLEWAKTHCEPNGWQVIDKDSDVSRDTQKMQEAFKKYKDGGTVPWLVVVHPSTTFSGPLPETAEATRGILTKYGGP